MRTMAPAEARLLSVNVKSSHWYSSACALPLSSNNPLANNPILRIRLSPYILPGIPAGRTCRNTPLLIIDTVTAHGLHRHLVVDEGDGDEILILAIPRLDRRIAAW